MYLVLHHKKATEERGAAAFKLLNTLECRQLDLNSLKWQLKKSQQQ
jgi:hypothetical protein